MFQSRQFTGQQLRESNMESGDISPGVGGGEGT